MNKTDLSDGPHTAQGLMTSAVPRMHPGETSAGALKAFPTQLPDEASDVDLLDQNPDSLGRCRSRPCWRRHPISD